MTRRAPNLTEQLAAALLQTPSGSAIRHEEAKRLTPKQIISRFEPDHYPVRFADRAALAAAGIPHIHHPSNITWRLRAEAQKKTRKIDVPQMAKSARIRNASSVRAALIDSGLTEDRPARKWRWPSRPLRSRNSFERRRT